ncbi:MULTISPECIES: 30S ribosomal protein S3ae [Pyrobaculum]|uniref:Small ribosomal subunit protein eS1 n=2 Tax=Pyrobaculum arsenaticum TaxID=121277 RepID=RS3A_PYRAR|nr:30S ribosomal protein S3ae [Pyrobaculum arsenaticum]A4WLY6.1 RecName: Full=Small ribosomal subunit protein eS1; AltName: Full=30S ribosomal protein S3Ae; AltName: Full=Ribosomal protein S1e [Pyrobaculum arsenaticum DSM 13514]ABP51403.1 SSU ribosomal protein S3AE [Pyrobaculum arsenaticum DSM 13514]MCY0889951.1 30S ribosomal protein S3ae [Pyrobaculum arsenaticum]NYR16227.1 30S ribosomal protein S3ae [Pyrobaculum arsenaticum]
MAERQKAVAKQEKVTISKRDPWALKKWFAVHAPPYLGGVFLAEVPATEAEKLLMRTLEVSLYDITKDISHLPVKLKFQIHRVEGLRALTRFKGLELSRDYVKSLVRKGTSKVVAITEVKTKDGMDMRVSVMVITAHRLGTAQKSAVRKKITETLLKKASEMDTSQFLKEVLEGTLAADLFIAAKKIAPLRKVEFAKIKVLKYPPEEERVVVKEAVAEAAS